MRRAARAQPPLSLEGQARRELGSLITSYLQAFQDPGGSPAAQGEKADWLRASLTLDPRGHEAEALVVKAS